MNTVIKEQFLRVIHHAMEEQFLAGATGMVLQHGKEVCYFEAGMADLEKQERLTRNHIFRLYSMTKPVIAAAAMILVERGSIDLFEPVSTYLPGFRNQCVCVDEEGNTVPVERESTLRNLLSMTAGLAYEGEESLTQKETGKVFREVLAHLEQGGTISTVEFANRIGQIPLCYQPGASWAYSTAADVMGAVIEVASGKPLAVFLEEEIFTPLGMTDTGFWVPPEKQHRLCVAYEQTATGLIPYTGNHLGIQNNMKFPPKFASGGAGLCATIDDYAKFTQMLLGHGVQILSEATRRYLTSCCLEQNQQQAMDLWPGLDGFSYGNFMRLLQEPGKAVTLGSKGEYGWDGWLGAYFANVPELDATLLLLYQRKDSGTTSFTRKMRNVFFSSLQSDESNT